MLFGAFRQARSHDRVIFKAWEHSLGELLIRRESRMPSAILSIAPRQGGSSEG